MQKQNIFSPLLNFFSSGLMIIVAPRAFFQSFEFIHTSWKNPLIYALCYKVLSALIYAWAFQAILASSLGNFITQMTDTVTQMYPARESLYSMPMQELFSSLNVWGLSLWTLLGHIPGVLFGSGVIWVISQISRSGFRYKETFNLINGFAPYSFFYALMFAILVIFSGSIQALALMGILFFVIGCVTLLLMVRTFHIGAQSVIADTLSKDPNALNRFYWVSALALLAPGILMVILAFIIRLSFFGG